MMDKRIAIPLLFLLASCAFGIPNRKHLTYRIDTAAFKQEQVNGIRIIKGGRATVTQSRLPNGEYKEYHLIDPGRTALIRDYYATGEIKHQGAMFCGQNYSIHMFYDKKGDAITEQQINYEAPYKIGLYDVNRKIRELAKIDVFKDKRKLTITRTAETSPPVYKAILPITNDPAHNRFITISANDGSVLSDEIKPAVL